MPDPARSLTLADLPVFALLRWLREEGHPATGAGIATLARTGTALLVAYQLLAAGLAAGVVGWALHWTWVPAIEQALLDLPLRAGIRSGRLDWPDRDPRILGGNPAFEVLVDPRGTPDRGDGADLRVELLPDRVRLRGALGWMDLRFPPDLEFDLGRIELSARWHAWRPFLVGGIAAAAGLALLPCWWLLSAVYAPAVALAGWILRKGLSMSDAWRLAGGALIPGAIVALVGIAGYAAGLYRLPGLVLTQGLHLLAGWVWILWGLIAARRPAAPGPDRPQRSRNPFRPSADASGGGRRRGRANPFGVDDAKR